MRVVTYNIHRCVGVDRKYDPARVAGVLKEIGADIIGLQEVDTGLDYSPPVVKVPVVPDRRKSSGDLPSPGMFPQEPEFKPVVATANELHPKSPLERTHQLDYLTTMTGHTLIEGLLIERPKGMFGNAILTSYPVLAVRRVDLTIRGGRQRRGALDVDLDIGGGRKLRVFVAHLGLALWERHFQVRRLLRALGNDGDSPILMMGDFNLWTRIFPRLRPLHRRLGHCPLVLTFPSFYPLLPLDRIWVQPQPSLRSLEIHQSALSRVASDHLPLIGEIQF
jgi:endonuclease/exonuclease/phosphatase family metal-dependent hydrolase